MTLVEFLTARLDERRKRYNSTDELYLHEVDSVRGPGWFEGECLFPACQWMTSGYEKVVEQAYYEHLDHAHDRAWVWADITAKRAILDKYAGHDERVTVALAHELSPAHADQRRQAVWEVLRLLASVYADHPDCDPRWADTPSEQAP